MTSLLIHEWEFTVVMSDNENPSGGILMTHEQALQHLTCLALLLVPGAPAGAVGTGAFMPSLWVMIT